MEMKILVIRSLTPVWVTHIFWTWICVYDMKVSEVLCNNSCTTADWCTVFPSFAVRKPQVKPSSCDLVFFFNSYSCLCNQPIQQPFILFYIVGKAYRNTSKLYAFNCNSSKSTAVKMANSNVLNFWTVKTYRKAELWITTLTKMASFFFIFQIFPEKNVHNKGLSI